VTIALGFSYSSGIVVSADREVTHGECGKTYELKIWHKRCDHNSIVVTGAGDWNYLKSAAEGIISEAESLGSLGEIKKVVRSEVKRVFKDEISLDPRSRTSDPPGFDLIVALAVEGQTAIIRTENLAVNIGHPPEVVGTGGPMARYLFKSFCHLTPSLGEGVVLAAYIVKAVKESAFGCGGPTDLIILTEGGEIHTQGTSLLEKRIFPDLAIIFEKLLYAHACVNRTDASFVKDIEFVSAHLAQKREANKRYKNPLTALLAELELS
jgi:20S proteasome alpha/beta subunit